jgi:hypothetical protein
MFMTDPLCAAPPFRADEAYPLPSGYFSVRRLAAVIDMAAYGSYQSNLLNSISQFPDCINFANFHRLTSGRVAKLSHLCTEAIGESTRVHPNAWLTVGRYDSQSHITPWGRTRHRSTPSVGSRTCWWDTTLAMFPQVVPSAPKPTPYRNRHNIVSSSDSFSTHVSHNGRLCRQFEQVNA